MRDTSPDGDSGGRSEPVARRCVADGGEQLQAHTVRLELVDEPGELLRALEPIATHGGNLLSIFHERGSLTPRGHIPVEIDMECPPGRLDTIVEALRENNINVIQTDAERYREHVEVVLVGDLIGTDLSATLSAIEDCEEATVVDMSLTAPNGEDVASARLSLAAAGGAVESALERVRAVAGEKDLRVIEPLVGANR